FWFAPEKPCFFSMTSQVRFAKFVKRRVTCEAIVSLPIFIMRHGTKRSGIKSFAISDIYVVTGSLMEAKPLAGARVFEPSPVAHGPGNIDEARRLRLRL